MRLLEIEASDAEFYDPADDQFSIMKLKNIRSPHLTLKHLNKLKKMRAAKKLEDLVRSDTLELMYGTGSDDQQQGGGAPF
jgi:hypothetical protein